MNSFTRLAYVLNVMVAIPAYAAPASDLSARVDAFECETILAGAKAPVAPGPAPTVPSALKATAALIGGDLNAFAQRRVALADLAAHEDAVADHQRELDQIQGRRAATLKWWREDGRGEFNVALDPSLRPVAEALMAKVERLVREAQTVEQIATVRTTVAAYTREILMENEELRQIARREQLERRRRQRADELRFDVHSSDNGAAVADAFERVAPGSPAPTRLADRLRTDLLLKGFVIDEVQMLRRLRRAANDPRVKVGPEIGRALEQRAQNDRSVISEGNHVATTELRRALLSLNRPGLFAGLGGASPRRMNLALRESIVADALANEALALTILQAGLNLMPPPAAPALPKQPSLTPPSKPNVPRKASSKSHYNRIKAEIARYQADVKSWQAAWEEYKRAVPRYKESTFPAYVERVKRLREAYDRTAKARQSFVAYLSYRRPEAFASPAVAQSVAAGKTEGARLRLAAGANSPAARSVRARVPSTVYSSVSSRSSSSSSTVHSSNDDWFFYWLLYNNTLNPYYAVNPHGAYALYQNDATHHAVDGGGATGLIGAAPALPADVRDQINQLNQDFTPLAADLSVMPDAPADVIAPDLADPVGAAQDWAANIDPNLGNGFSDFSSPAGLADVQMPDVSAPDFSSPSFSMPDISVPDISIPSVDTSTPSFDSSSSYSSPSYESSSSYSSSDSSSNYSSSSSYDSSSSSSSYDSGSSSSSSFD